MPGRIFGCLFGLGPSEKRSAARRAAQEPEFTEVNEDSEQRISADHRFAAGQTTTFC